MANFKTHVSGGVALGMTVSAVSWFGGLTGHVLWFLPLLGVGAVVGSIAPDVDSDTSLPLHIAFGSLSLSSGVLTMIYIMQTDSSAGSYLPLIAWPLSVMVLVWSVGGWLFRKFTRHRGMVHSIPAAVLGALIVFLITLRPGFQLTEWQSFLLSLSFGLGFLLHLLFDEIFAAVNFHGLKFAPKKSFGSAMKFYSSRRPATLAVYGAIGLILFFEQMRLVSLASRLINWF